MVVDATVTTCTHEVYHCGGNAATHFPLPTTDNLYMWAPGQRGQRSLDTLRQGLILCSNTGHTGVGAHPQLTTSPLHTTGKPRGQELDCSQRLSLLLAFTTILLCIGCHNLSWPVRISLILLTRGRSFSFLDT